MIFIEIIAKILGIFFLALGIIEGFRYIIYVVLKPHRRGSIYVHMHFSGHEEGIEFTIREMVMKLKWLQGNENKSILCIDDGMDEETLAIVKKLANEYPIIHIVKNKMRGYRKWTKAK